MFSKTEIKNILKENGFISQKIIELESYCPENDNSKRGVFFSFINKEKQKFEGRIEYWKLIDVFVLKTEDWQFLKRKRIFGTPTKYEKKYQGKIEVSIYHKKDKKNSLKISYEAIKPVTYNELLKVCLNEVQTSFDKKDKFNPVYWGFNGNINDYEIDIKNKI